MSRTNLCRLALTIPLLLALGLALRSPNATPATAQQPPNVVFFITDDQRYDTLEYMPIVQRELVAHGVSFTNTYATTPLCCPSRASILTGLYAHHHGVWRNDGFHGGYRWLDDSSTLAVWLQQAGIRTMLLGKYLNLYNNPRVPPGWDEWYAILDTGKKYYDYTVSRNGDVRIYGDKDKWYSAEVLTRFALEELLPREPGRPFFLYFSFDGPHAPPEPAKQDRGTFADLPPQRLPSFDEQDVTDKPSWVQALPPLTPAIVTELDDFRRDQLEVLQSIDQSIGIVLDALRADGRLDNTWIVFMSDNGLSLGEHRLDRRKSCGYEECARVPLIVVPPASRAAEFAAPRADASLVLNIDLAPTLADLYGVAPGRPVDGQSLLPLLANPAAPWRTEGLLRLWADEHEPHMSFWGLRADKWKYLAYDNGERELYDLESDPFELQNLAARPELAPLIADLQTRLERLMH